MRLRDRDLYKEEGQECKDRRLHKTDEDLKGHNGDREYHRDEMLNDQDHYLARKDVSKETERKRDQTRHLGKELDDSHQES